MRKTELLDLPVAEPDPSSVNGRIVKYNACARLHNIRGEMVLSVDCFDATCRILLYRVFMTRMKYMTVELDDNRGVRKWHTARIGNILSEYIPKVGLSYPLADRKSKEPVEIFLGHQVDGNPVIALNDYQLDLEEVRLRMKHQARLDKIRKFMDKVKPVPNDFTRWIDTDVLKCSQYLIYKSIGKNHQKCFCSVCSNEYEIEGLRHRKECKCLKCNANVTAIADGKIISGRIFDTAHATFVQAYDRGVMLRIFKADRALIRDNGRWRVETRHSEIIRDTIHEDGKNDVFAYGMYRNRDNGLQFCCPASGYFYSYPVSYVFPNGLSDELKDTFAKYSAIDYMACHGEAFRPDLYLLFYQKFPGVELLVKHGGFRFARTFSESYIYDPAGDIATIRKHFGELEDGDLEAVHIWKNVDKSPYSATAEDINAWKGMSVYRLSDLLRFAPLKKIKQYLSGLEGSISFNCSILADYWMNASRIGMDMRDKRVLYPDDLAKAHDDAADKYKIIKSERIEKCLKERYEKLSKRFAFSFGGLFVAVPSSVDDFINESKALSHCVRTYVDKAAFGETTILFVRSEQTPLEPYYTMEVKDGRVQQLRGAHNCEPTENVLIFKERFCKEFGLAA